MTIDPATAAELDTLRSIALAAGALLRGGREDLRRIDYKSSTDMVTDLDRRAEELVTEALVDAFPDDGIAAEEGTSRPSSSGRTWSVDPLDGTTNYVHGHPFYAVSLARVDERGPQMAVVHAPELDELWSAVRGGGARLERPREQRSRNLGPLGPRSLGDALLATGFPYARGEACSRNCAAVEAVLLHPCHGVRRGGSAALDLCHVGGGRIDGYWELSLRPWDVAGGALVALEAGATVTDLQGGDRWHDGRHVLAAAPGLHGEMLELLGEVLGDVVA